MADRNPLLFQTAAPGAEEHQTQITEITLRDLFAAAVAAGATANPTGEGPQPTPDDFADYAYTVADAMLARRQR